MEERFAARRAALDDWAIRHRGSVELVAVEATTGWRWVVQIALAIPLLAALLGLLNGFRMTRLPDPKPSSAAEGMLMG